LEVIDTVLDELGNVIVPAIADRTVQRRATGMLSLLLHLQSLLRLQPALDAAELDDLARVLGTRAETVNAGLESLHSLLAQDAPQRDAELIRYFSRSADRSLTLWPAVGMLASRPLDRVVVA
jgi:CII-binding regulator of phage lambda lysogenization HflD